MLSKIVTARDEEFDAPKWLEKHGSYNEMPMPFEEVEMNDVLSKLGSYTPRFVEYRQVHGLAEAMRETKILWFHDEAIAIVFPNLWHVDQETKKIVWDEPVRFFRVGCKHKFHELSMKQCSEEGIEHFGMCWHVVRCKRCGYTESYDSSG